MTEMLLGGIQKNSMIDYPGKVSCVLFLSGCNFNCPYCHNPELVAKGGSPACPYFPEENGIYDFLKERRGFLDGVVISGGEPTLHDDLIPLCEKIKNMGYPVKLDTNGSKPEVVRKLVNTGLVDYLAMDIKTDPLNYSPLIAKDCDPADIFSSIRIIMDSGLPYEFKTTCVKPLVSEAVIDSISHYIHGAKLYALQQFHQHEVLNPEFFRKDERCYTDSELMCLKSAVESRVQKCIVR